jgi:histidinol-phosphate aminotransferase
MIVQGIPSPGDGLRLHLNENTGGCSECVMDAIRALKPTDIATYPNYRRDVTAVGRHFGIDPDWLILTNGLDEGIFLSAIATFGRAHDASLEAIVPVPAFDPYLTATAAVDAAVIRLPPGPDFAFPADAIVAAVTPKTRLIFLNTPNNPTGQTIPREVLRRVIAAAPHATVLIDEAYVEFDPAGSFLDALAKHTNVVIGRTFSKAYGLAGMRIGVLIGHPQRLEAIRAVTPVFNMNTVAMTAMHAALADTAFLPAYVGAVDESRARFYAAAERLGIEYWKSAANFVLMRVGARAPEIVAHLAASGVHVRDRSRDPYSPGCIRVTAGVTAHTDRGIKALEEAAAAGLIETRMSR